MVTYENQNSKVINKFTIQVIVKSTERLKAVHEAAEVLTSELTKPIGPIRIPCMYHACKKESLNSYVNYSSESQLLSVVLPLSLMKSPFLSFSA